MDRRLFSVPMDLVLSDAVTGAPAAGAGTDERAIRHAKLLDLEKNAYPALTARWVSAVQDLGADFQVDVGEPTLLESPGEAGEMQWSESLHPLIFESVPPEGAKALRLVLPDGSTRLLARAALSHFPDKLPDPAVSFVGKEAARFVVPVFSERFTRQDEFVAHVERLHTWILQQPPFDREAVGNDFALRAHFWSSDPQRGLFDTGDERNQGERLFYGNAEVAKRLLSRFIGTAGVSLILINSALRGGAGGRPGYSAWSSISSKPGEFWGAVCLHELGHGFGLADEYLDDARANEPIGVLEPNVSADPRPSHTPWRSLANLADEPAPSFSWENQDEAGPGAVGTFAGARYRGDLYRSSHRCLMRTTTSGTSFCAACQAHIASYIQGDEAGASTPPRRR